jgi:hypothetical protein
LEEREYEKCEGKKQRECCWELVDGDWVDWTYFLVDLFDGNFGEILMMESLIHFPQFPAPHPENAPWRIKARQE